MALVLIALAAVACGGDDDDDDAVAMDAGTDAPSVADAGDDAGLPTARVDVVERGTDTVIDQIPFYDPFDVVISEAPPDTTLTLRARRTGFSSEAVFTTDDERVPNRGVC